ncbi:MAG: hypothetical protein QM786_17510 [Breznakibacter sp.]
MKRIIISFSFAMLLGCAVFAQEEGNNDMKTIFGRPDMQSIGGYGALNVGYTKIHDLDAITIGARGAVVLNHNLALGLGGHGFVSEPTYDLNLAEDYEFAGGYGGIYVEPIVGWRHPVHLSFPILIGAGGIGYIKHWGNYEDDNTDDNERYDEDSNAFFVIEPGVELEFNLVKFMRLAVVGSYRYTSDVKLNYKKRLGTDFSEKSIAPADMLRGFNVGLIMKFGKF